MRRLALALLCACSLTLAEEYTLGPDSQPQAGVPKGVVTRYKLEPGKFYPGTPHNYAIYVPRQYDAAKPAPFMIFLDGSGFAGNNVRVPVVFDNLIAKGDLPATIGIFIDPGVLPVLSDRAQNRYERIFEYDSISGRFAQFLIEELIPAVASKYALSKDPNDHAISGVSTGAVGAFVAAWERPDQFRRVLSFIGTFVAMKGADALPALIRKTEPKPIRIFMQDGRADHITAAQPYGTFYAGSWPINNRVMAEALEFAGYDVKLTIGDEGHNMKQGAAIMPEALRWLWRDYPKPIVAREPAAMEKPEFETRGRVSSVVWMDKPWERVKGSYQSVASPAGDREGSVYFADPAANRIYKLGRDGKVARFKDDSSGAAALRVGPDGRLYCSQLGRKRIVSYGPGGDEKVVAQNVEAIDLALTAKGGIYFLENLRVGFIDSKGQKRTVTVYDRHEIGLASALSLSPDQAMLIVAGGQTRFSWSFQIAADGSLVNGEPFYRLEMPESSWLSDARGVTVDRDGLVYFTSAVGIQVFEQNGRCTRILSKPEFGNLAGLAFAGTDLNWLYVAEGGKLFRRPVKIKGVTAWEPVKPPKPLL